MSVVVISSGFGFSSPCVDPPPPRRPRCLLFFLFISSHVLLTGPVAMFGVPNGNFHVTRRRERLPGFAAHHVVTFRYLVSSSFGRTFLRLLYVSFQLFCFLFFLRLGRVASRLRFLFDCCLFRGNTFVRFFVDEFTEDPLLVMFSTLNAGPPFFFVVFFFSFPVPSFFFFISTHHAAPTTTKASGAAREKLSFSSGVEIFFFNFFFVVVVAIFSRTKKKDLIVYQRAARDSMSPSSSSSSSYSS